MTRKIGDLIKSWEDKTQEITKAFCDKYYGEDLSRLPYSAYWIKDQIGGIFVANDQFWSLDDMIVALKTKCSKRRLFDWYDRRVEAYSHKKSFQNLETYAKYGLIKLK